MNTPPPPINAVATALDATRAVTYWPEVFNAHDKVSVAVLASA